MPGPKTPLRVCSRLILSGAAQKARLPTKGERRPTQRHGDRCAQTLIRSAVSCFPSCAAGTSVVLHALPASPSTERSRGSKRPFARLLGVRTALRQAHVSLACLLATLRCRIEGQTAADAPPPRPSAALGFTSLSISVCKCFPPLVMPSSNSVSEHAGPRLHGPWLRLRMHGQRLEPRGGRAGGMCICSSIGVVCVHAPATESACNAVGTSEKMTEVNLQPTPIHLYTFADRYTDPEWPA